MNGIRAASAAAYLKGLVWDGVPRVDAWLSTHLGVPDTAYARAVGAAWLISAVARACKPGCESGGTIVFDTAPGVATCGLALLGGEWFRSVERVEPRALANAWIVGVSELRSEDVPLFGANADTFRALYTPESLHHPRRWVSAVLARGADVELDSLPARFWPVRVCQVLDGAQLAAARDQLWSEARDRFLAGEAWQVPFADALRRAEPN